MKFWNRACICNRRLRALAALVIGISLALPPRPAAADQELDSVVGLFELLLDADAETARNCLGILLQKVHSGEVDAERLQALRQRLAVKLEPIVRKGAEEPLYVPAVLLSCAWKDQAACRRVRELALDPQSAPPLRLQALETLFLAQDPQATRVAAQLLEAARQPETQAPLLATLGRSTDPQIAPVVLQQFPKLDAATRPKAIELLTQRPSWSKTLLEAIGEGHVSSDLLNANQVSKMLASKDPEIARLVAEKWGVLRTSRNPQREQVIQEVRGLLQATPGDPHRGKAVFHKVCGQCHQIYGEGQEVGPDITVNGRGSYEQLLSNVLDPSLVIGAAYQARTVITADGRVLTGLAAEDNEQRMVLKLQGGKTEVIARQDVEEVQVSQLSLMPEGLEKQLPAQELADLFAFLALDKPPDDPDAAPIPASAPQ